MAEAVIAAVEFATAADGLTITLTATEAFAAAAVLELVAASPCTRDSVRRGAKQILAPEIEQAA